MGQNAPNNASGKSIRENSYSKQMPLDSETRFRAIFENSGTGIAVVDMQGRGVDCNPAMLKMLGYTNEELQCMPFTDFTHPDDREIDWSLYKELISGKRDKYQIEKRYIRKDGRIVWGNLVASLIPDREGVPKYALGMVQDITERKEAEQQLIASREQLRALSDRLTKAKEEEGIRISRELHDALGGALTRLKWGLTAVHQSYTENGSSDDSEGIEKKITEMVLLVDSTINTVRRISSELRPGVLDDLGLISAIEWHARDFETNTGIVCRFDSQSEHIELAEEQATAVFRIYQEAMTNVLRHSAASKVRILIEEEENDFVLEVSDNGRGIQEQEKLGTHSLGIVGMRERAHSVGATVRIVGVNDKGTIVTVRLAR